MSTARAAAQALHAIGAKRTAVRLEKALAPGATPAQREALDARFYAAPEDLARPVARHLRLAPVPPHAMLLGGPT